MNTSNEALSKIRELMEEMKEWESDFHSKKTSILMSGGNASALDDEYRQKLTKILGKHVLDTGKNYGRLIDLGAGNPTAYDFSTDQVESTEGAGNKFVYTYKRSAGFKNKYRLTLQKQESQWLVKKKELFNHNDKWTAIPI